MKRTVIPSLTNWPIYSLKAGLASGLAWVLTTAFHVDDPVSATFIAVVCTSPTVITGLRRGVEQLIGSVLGGTFATAALLAGLRGPVALGLAVAGSMLSSGLTGARSAGVTAGFTALYVILIGGQAPETLFGQRLVAVALGAIAALLVNFGLSAMQYGQVFRRRMGLARELVAQATEGPHQHAIDQAFVLIGQLTLEMADADREHWSLQPGLHERLAAYRQEILLLRRILHFAQDALIREEAVAGQRAAEVLRGETDPADGDENLATAVRDWAVHARATMGQIPRMRDELPGSWLTWG